MAVADTSVADARPAKPGGPAVYIGNGQAGERHLANGIGLDEFRSASLVAEGCPRPARVIQLQPPVEQLRNGLPAALLGFRLSSAATL